MTPAFYVVGLAALGYALCQLVASIVLAFYLRARGRFGVGRMVLFGLLTGFAVGTAWSLIDLSAMTSLVLSAEVIVADGQVTGAGVLMALQHGVFLACVGALAGLAAWAPLAWLGRSTSQPCRSSPVRLGRQRRGTGT